MEIRLLQQDDRRDGLDCGDREMDDFLERYAGQNRFKHHVGATYVAVEGGAIVGFSTVAPGQTQHLGVRSDLRARLPGYPLPVLRLARLAVDRSRHGEGIGSTLLLHCLGLAVTIDALASCWGMLVDAYPDATGFYQRFGFRQLVPPVAGASELRPRTVEMILTLDEILRAAGRAG